MHAVPAAGEFDVANVHVLADLKEDGVVRRVHERHIADGHVAAIDEDERVRPAHLLLAGRVEDLVAIDSAGTGDLNILRAVSQDQCPVPFAPLGLGHEARHRRMLVQIGVLGADQSGARLQVERHAALEVHGRRQIPPGSKSHQPATGLGTGIDRLVDCGGIERLAVADSPKIADVEHPGFGPDSVLGPRERRDCQDHPRRDRQHPASITNPSHVQHPLVSHNISISHLSTSSCLAHLFNRTGPGKQENNQGKQLAIRHAEPSEASGPTPLESHRPQRLGEKGPENHLGREDVFLSEERLLFIVAIPSTPRGKVCATHDYSSALCGTSAPFAYLWGGVLHNVHKCFVYTILAHKKAAIVILRHW